MEPTTLAARDEPTRKLLEQGAHSYLKALAALTAFEQEVQKGCRQVLLKYLDQYSASLRVQPVLRKDEISNVVYPKNWEAQEDWRTVGVELRRAKPTSAISVWSPLICLVWQSEEPSFYAQVGEWLYPKKAAETLYNKFHDINGDVFLEGNEVEVDLRQSLKVEEAAAFEESLDILFQRWIKVWKKVGGIKAAFKGLASA